VNADTRIDAQAHALQAMAAIGSTSHYDGRLARYDVECSRAHVSMMRQQNIIHNSVADKLLDGLATLQTKVEAGEFKNHGEEDIHTALERALEGVVGPIAGNVAIARARNDLAVTVLKLWLREQTNTLLDKLLAIIEAFCEQAKRHVETVVPGFSHLQTAQVITFGHLCNAYGETFLRDAERLRFVRSALCECPLGSAALAGTSYPIDRHYTAKLLGFERPSANSIDSVGERGFALDFLSVSATLALDLSRFAAEIVFWTSQPVGFVRLPDSLVTGSAAMPHKRNPDSAELVRAKCGRVVANLHRVQMVVKGLPLSYFRDLQEDKEPLFDTADSLHLMLDTTLALVTLMEPQVKTMLAATAVEFITSSDLADWLVGHRGIPFREAHHIVARLVQLAQQEGTPIDALPEHVRVVVDGRLAGNDWPSISVDESVRSRSSLGGTAPKEVRRAAIQLGSRVHALRCLSAEIPIT
jgi:argininosuccinate lyase